MRVLLCEYYVLVLSAESPTQLRLHQSNSIKLLPQVWQADTWGS